MEATQRTDSGRLGGGVGGAGVLVGVEARRPVQWEGAVARTCGPARCAGRRNPLSGSDDSPSWAAPTSIVCRLRAPGDGNRRSAEMSPFSAYGSFNQTDERYTRILVASFILNLCLSLISPFLHLSTLTPEFASVDYPSHWGGLVGKDGQIV